MDRTPVFPAASPPVTDRVYRRFSVAEYEEMIQSGIIKEDDNVELLEGWIVEKMTKNPSHTLCVGLVNDAIAGLSLKGWFINLEQPIMTDDSEPEPDISVIQGQRRDYRSRKPQAADIAFVVEVADTSLPDDRQWKLGIYARAGIGIYWIVNLRARRIEVYTEPYTDETKSGYREETFFGAIDAVPVVIDGKEIGRLAVAELLP